MKSTITFGLQLDELILPVQNNPVALGNHHFGPQQLLQFLEGQLGLSGHPGNNQYLRIEQYRQAMQHCLEQTPDSFYANSFEADQFATATALLALREASTRWLEFSIKERESRSIGNFGGD